MEKTLEFNPFELDQVEREHKEYIEKMAEHLEGAHGGKTVRYTLDELEAMPEEELNQLERHV